MERRQDSVAVDKTIESNVFHQLSAVTTDHKLILMDKNHTDIFHVFQTWH
jgi:hypothetical protein